jgi:hypothetical protein
MQKKYGFVYLWFDRKHKRYYVGSHWGTENDGYVCSSIWMRKSHTRRPNDFKRRILKRLTTSRSELLTEEQRWLNMIKPTEKKIRYYNLNLIITNPWHQHLEKRITVGQKISQAKTGKVYGPRGPYGPWKSISEKFYESRKVASEKLKGHPSSMKDKIRGPNKNKSKKRIPNRKPRDEELCKKTSEFMLGNYNWTNGIETKRSRKCPGDEWIRGMAPRNK